MPLENTKRKKIYPFWERLNQTLNKHIPDGNKIRKNKNSQELFLNTKQKFLSLKVEKVFFFKFVKFLWRIWKIKSSISNLNLYLLNKLPKLSPRGGQDEPENGATINTAKMLTSLEGVCCYETPEVKVFCLKGKARFSWNTVALEFLSKRTEKNCEGNNFLVEFFSGFFIGYYYLIFFNTTFHHNKLKLQQNDINAKAKL